MPDTSGMRMSFAAIVGWVLAAGVVAGGIGAYPTWKLSGPEGLTAMLAAGGLVLAGMLVSAAVITRAARSGPGRAAFAFIVCSAFRAIISVLAGGVICALTSLPPRVLLTWLAMFYLAMLAAEAACLVKALRRDAMLVALGEIRRGAAARPPEQTPEGQT